MSEPVILAVDTCFNACSAAVVQGDRVFASRNVAMERGHAEALAPMVEAVMRDGAIAFAGIDRLAVTTGPGSFTGQRVGLAFMRGLRVALQVPLVGVTSLKAMAERARRQSGKSNAAAVHDAKRGEVYLETVGAASPARVMPFGEAVALLRNIADLALTGTAAPRLAHEIGIIGGVVESSAPDAIWVARVAAEEPVGALPRPLYLRPPDAKKPS